MRDTSSLLFPPTSFHSFIHFIIAAAAKGITRLDLLLQTPPATSCRYKFDICALIRARISFTPPDCTYSFLATVGGSTIHRRLLCSFAVHRPTLGPLVRWFRRPLAQRRRRAHNFRHNTMRFRGVMISVSWLSPTSSSRLFTQSGLCVFCPLAPERFILWPRR